MKKWWCQFPSDEIIMSNCHKCGKYTQTMSTIIDIDWCPWTFGVEHGIWQLCYDCRNFNKISEKIRTFYNKYLRKFQWRLALVWTGYTAFIMLMQWTLGFDVKIRMITPIMFSVGYLFCF